METATPPFDPLLLYGATGYTGRLLVEEAIRVGMRPLLAGRDARKLALLGERLGLPYRAGGLEDPARLDAMLRDVRVVLNAAGPFEGTAGTIAAASLRAGTHYLDVSGEPSAIESLVVHHAEARRRSVMLMPGVGFDVVASDCLAAHVARRHPAPRRLALGLRGLTLASRGSARTFARWGGRGILVRRGGRLVALPPGDLRREFDYGDGPRSSLALTWGDVSTAFYTTGIPDVEVYFEASPVLVGALVTSRQWGLLLNTAAAQAWLEAGVGLLPEGPTAEQRAAVRVVVVAEVEGGGRRSCSRLHTPQAYSFTATSGIAIARRVLEGDVEPGFQTPARVYGADLALSLAGVSREDLW